MNISFTVHFIFVDFPCASKTFCEQKKGTFPGTIYIQIFTWRTNRSNKKIKLHLVILYYHHRCDETRDKLSFTSQRACAFAPRQSVFSAQITFDHSGPSSFKSDRTDPCPSGVYDVTESTSDSQPVPGIRRVRESFTGTKYKLRHHGLPTETA